MEGWYILLSQVSVILGEPVRQLTDRIDFPLANAFLLGLLGATAPCQLTTNLSAIAYVSRDLEHGRPWQEAATYTLGKALVYTVVGGVVIGLGLQIQGAAVPVVVAARKLLGPLMITIGVVFLGLLRLRMSLGHNLAGKLRRRISTKGPWGAFLMGVVFAFAFCPTLFLLFFGLTIPLGLRSNAGLLVPGLFAVGTAVPLLAYAGLLTTGSELAGAYTRSLSRGHSTVKRVAGAIFILAGINDTLTYWFL
jgi:sulfite exporter TauE/SafE